MDCLYRGVPDAAGQLTWQQQFFDNKVEVEVSPQPGSALSTVSGEKEMKLRSRLYPCD